VLRGSSTRQEETAHKMCKYPLVIVFCCTTLSAASAQTADVPKEVRALEGTYTGSWTMHGIDEKGEVVKLMSWTDIVKATNGRIDGGRAYVKTTDEMTFDGTAGRPFKVEGKEGYLLNKNGSLGEYFIETYGRANRLANLADNVWTYAASAKEQELTRLGFPKGS